MQVATRYTAVSDPVSRSRGDALVAWLRDYGARRINSRLIDERRTIPPYVALDFGNQGLLGIQVEERFGGLGLRSREVARVLEQAAGIDLSLGTFLLVCLFPGVRPLATFGGDALRAAILPDLAKGRTLAGFAQTEPGAGSNFAAMAASAVAGGDGYRLSGDKVWIGNGTWAGWLTAMAQEIDASGRRRGLVALAVDVARPGVELGRELLSMGMRGVVQSEVGFRGVHVPPDCVLGSGERGLEVAVDSMSWSRFAIAATCIGSMKRCVQLALRFAGRRAIATGRVIEHPVVRAELGESILMAAGAEALLYRTAEILDLGRGVPAEVLATCKVMGSEFLWRTADRLMQVLGSRGYDEANEAPQILRDARVTRIFEGATEPLAAFVGAAAQNPRADLLPFLRDDLAAPAAADELALAMAALRGRREAAAPPSRAGEAAFAGWAAMWALIRGAAEQAAARGTGAEPERTAAWARQRAREAAARARAASGDDVAMLGVPELEKAAASFADAIGDVEQRLPGGRETRDPLLRLEPSGS